MALAVVGAARARIGAARAQVLLAGGTIGLIFFSAFVVPMPFWDGRPSLPRGGGAAEAVGWLGLLVTAGFVLALCLPYRPYSLALRALSSRQSGGCVGDRLLLALTAALATIGLAIYPRFGSDVFDYAGFERTWVVYGDNPLIALVANRAADWGAPYVWYPAQTPGYGPLWAIISWPIIRLAGESAMAEVFGYKLLSAVAYAACCWLIWTGVERGRRQRALVLFAWSPLVVFEVLGKVHNDILPAVGVLAMVWLVRRGNTTAAALAVLLGALVKPTAVIAASLLAVDLLRRGGWRRLLLAGTSSVLLVGVAYAPFWVGLQTLSAVWQQTSRPGWSIDTLLALTAGWLSGAQHDTSVRLVLGLVWLSVCALLIARPPVEPAFDLAARSGWLLVATLLLLGGAVFAHYFVPAVALAAVANDARFERLVVWLSVGGLAAYSIELLSLTFGPGWLGSTAFQITGSLVLLGPAAMAMALCARRKSA